VTLMLASRIGCKSILEVTTANRLPWDNYELQSVERLRTQEYGGESARAN
jgi:hypothetical protein